MQGGPTERFTLFDLLSDEEPEEELSLEQLEEKAGFGDARAQTRVSGNTHTQTQTHRLPPGIVVSPAV